MNPEDGTAASESSASDDLSDHVGLALAFAALTGRFANPSGLPFSLQDFVGLVVELVPAAAWVSITQGLDARFETLAQSHHRAADLDTLQRSLGTGPSVDAVLGDWVFSSDDLPLDPRWSGFGAVAARDVGARSVLSRRLLLDHRPDANVALTLWGDHLDAFDDAAWWTLLLLATHLTTLLDRPHELGTPDVVPDSDTVTAEAVAVLTRDEQMSSGQAHDLLRLAGQLHYWTVGDVARHVATTGGLSLRDRSQ